MTRSFIRPAATEPMTPKGDPASDRSLRRLIDLYEESHVRDVCRSMQCTDQQLLEAAEAVGYSSERVSEYLKSRLWRAVDTAIVARHACIAKSD